MNQLETIWQNLTTHKISDRDIEEREGKGGKVLHYYKWASCWRELINRFPDADYAFELFERDGKAYDVMYYADGSASVHCTVTIQGVSRSMWLPVMNYKNEAITNPNARDVSDAKMRCLVKTIAMFGLGLDLYEGKYNPDSEENNNGI
ncbi:MAG: DUF1071 domain-containing protein [Betaproteobacteria bacterium]